MTRHRRAEGPTVAWYHPRRFPDRPRGYSECVTLKGSAGEIDIFARNAQGVFVPVTQLEPSEEAP